MLILVIVAFGVASVIAGCYKWVLPAKSARVKLEADLAQYLTEEDRKELARHDDLASVTLEELFYGDKEIQAEGVRTVPRNFHTNRTTWNGVSSLPDWLRQGLGEGLEEYCDLRDRYAVAYQANNERLEIGRKHYEKGMWSQGYFHDYLSYLEYPRGAEELKAYEERAIKRWKVIRHEHFKGLISFADEVLSSNAKAAGGERKRGRLSSVRTKLRLG